MIKAIIVDDELLAIETLSLLLQTYCTSVTIVGTANNAIKAASLINDIEPDLVFLDIDMPGGNGFDLLEAFKERTFKVVFTTASSEYAIRALKLHAEDYLLKPIDIDELQFAVKQVEEYWLLKSTQVSAKVIALSTAESLQFVAIEKIIRLEANDNYTHFYIEGIKNKIIVSKTLKHFEDELDKKIFCRIHQSHIISLNYLDKYVKGRGGYVTLKDGTNLDVSIRKKEDFLAKLNS